MTNTVFVTFVYPGSETRLPNMFRSLNEQSDYDFDILIFNDGLQNINKICEQYLIKHAEIETVTGTISKIRALGLRQLKSRGYENVIFGDADDSFARNRVEVSKNLLQSYDLVVNEIDVHSMSLGQVLPRYFQKRIPANTRFDFEAIRECNFIGFTNSSVRASKIPIIDFPDHITALDWALFSTLLLQGSTAFFTSETTTSYFIHEKSHYDLLCKDPESAIYKAQVRLQHYDYLSSIGFAFKREYEQNEALLHNLTSGIAPDFYDLKPSSNSEYPLWWDLQINALEEKTN